MRPAAACIKTALERMYHSRASQIRSKTYVLHVTHGGKTLCVSSRPNTHTQYAHSCALVQPSSAGAHCRESAKIDPCLASAVYRLPDSRIIVRLEPFQDQNGPDLYVYLSGHPMPRSSAQVHDQGAFEIARLRGNIGNQKFELPGDLDLSQYHAIVIYCKRFAEVFSTAELLMPAR